MIYGNNLNPAKGRKLQEQVCLLLEDFYKVDFVIYAKIPIGKPSKDHKFDLVSKDKKIYW